MTDVCKALEISKLNTTAYHPQCDGLVEHVESHVKETRLKVQQRIGTLHKKVLVLFVVRDGPALTE